MNQKKYRVKYPEKARAHYAVAYAVKAGKIIQPVACEVCKAEVPLHGHHEDYSKQLEVIWVCHNCHENIHHPNRKLPKPKQTPNKVWHKKYQPAPKREVNLAKAKELRESGSSYASIAKEIGASIGTVFKWLNDRQYK